MRNPSRFRAQSRAHEPALGHGVSCKDISSRPSPPSLGRDSHTWARLHEWSPKSSCYSAFSTVTGLTARGESVSAVSLPVTRP